ncbi:PPC domain-containing DNA-binding protein [Vibrio sp. VB16]|uniref:PPC domain-containing DNA-binding protein n=1 Tax=Vibrio sp. VB16 TaxID=2785746 RepID=UPI00189D4AA1|nr:PPC domain-containing DNA-binding protein [Vibrio sp. VB16]UGA53377.1 DNA-binding protein [Vibrio sp. VB16]
MLTPIAIRLIQGADLKKSIAQLVTQHKIKAGSIASCVGCLSSVSLRLAGAQKTLQLNGPLEIVSIMGTLTPQHQHIHLTVSDNTGRVIGGHLLDGSIIDTTAELIVHHYPVLSFSREFDDTTGFTELVVNDEVSHC